MALANVSKNEMLKGINNVLTDIQLKYQDGTTSSIITEASLWEATPTSGVLDQDAIVTFTIDTTGGQKNISGFNLLFSGVLGVTANFQQIYNYPSNGTFTFDGTSIVVN